MARHDWSAIEIEYVTSNASLRDLADQHGMTESLLFKRSVSGGWDAKRKAYGSNLVAETQTQAIVEGIDIRVRALRVVNLACDDYESKPTPDKLRALTPALQLAAVLEGYETQRGALTLKDWRDVVAKRGGDTEGIVEYAARLARAGLDRGDSGANGSTGSEEHVAGAGWTD